MNGLIFNSITNMFKGNNNYMINMDNTQEIISRLKFIGCVKKGEKINTKHMYVQQEGFVTLLARTFVNQDNRNNTLTFCQETISRSFELLVTYERSTKSEDKVIFRHLLQDLTQATNGLLNLKETYITDTKFRCDMDTILQVISAKLEKYSENMISDEE